MGYGSAEDIAALLTEDMLLQLADDEGGAALTSEKVQAVIAEAIDQADSEIDAHVGVVHTGPMVTVPRLISNLSARLAICHLFRRRGSLPDAWEVEQGKANRLLESISSGKIKLPLTAEDGTPTGTSVIHASAPARIFTSSVLDKF